MKKIILCASLIFTAFQIHGGEIPEGFKEYELSNGMHIFVLEDFSTPNVHIEYSARAGVSRQEADNTGFFVLYSQLFSNAGKYSYDEDSSWLMDRLTAECNADSARYYLTAQSYEVKDVLSQLSKCAFAPIFQDKELSEKFAQNQKEITENAFSIEGFINSSIDSRVFSQAPWKHDSGIYPALFQKISQTELRAKLSDIAKKFYSPQNSALFISGGIKKETAVFYAEKTFGKFQPSNQLIEERNTIMEQNPEHKNFVLTDPEFSPDMTQLVVQYTTLTMNQCDIASFILNQNNSSLKQQLTEKKELNILAGDYINVDSSHKNGSSRMIVQSLLEKSDVSAFTQTENFRTILLSQISNFSREEFEAAKYFLANRFRISLSDSTSFMNLLSQFWAIDGTPRKVLSNSGSQGDASSLVHRFVNHDLELLSEDFDELTIALENETPWVFTFVNSDNLKNLNKRFINRGYEIITTKNGSWYTQKLFQNLADKSKESSSEQKDFPDQVLFDQHFYELNAESFSTKTLSNGIEVITKKQSGLQRTAISLYFSSGELNSPKKRYGLESILIGELCQNLRRNAYRALTQGSFSAMPEISWDTGTVSSIITIECFNEEIQEALRCLYETLVFAEIIPSDIDGLIYNRKSDHIIKTGSTIFQLYSYGIKRLYPKSVYEQLYTSDSQILKDVKFNEVLELFPPHLNSKNIKLLASGNFDTDSFTAQAEELFSSLKTWETEAVKLPEPGQVKESYKVKLQHLFLTDVTKEKAGPRPQVLIPTTDFSDPVQFWLKNPEGNGDDACIFDALLFALKNIIDEEIGRDTKYDKISVQIKEREPLIPFSVITFINVKYTSLADELFEKGLTRLTAELSENESFLERLKVYWIRKTFEDTEKNSRNLELLRTSVERPESASRNEEHFYLSHYRHICGSSKNDYLSCLNEYFSTAPYMRLYSADSKK